MSDTDQAYVGRLAGQLTARHAALLLHNAEDDLALLRGQLAIVATWIHNPVHDLTARQALAQALGLPEPRKDNPHG